MSDSEHIGVARNTLYFLAAQTLGFVFEFAFFAQAARLLGADRFGQVAVACALVSILSVVADFGMRIFLVGELAKGEMAASQLLNNAAGMKAVLIVGCYAVMAGYVEWVDGASAPLVYLLGLTVVAKAYAGLCYAAFQAWGRMYNEAVARVAGGLLPLAGLAILPPARITELTVAGVYVLGGAVALTYSLIVLARSGSRLGISLDRERWRRIAVGAFPFGVAAVLVVMFYWSNTLVLSFVADQRTVGLYNAAHRLSLAVLCLPTALNGAMFPTLVKRTAVSAEAVTLLIRRAVRYMLIAGLPLGVGISVMSRELLLAIYGPEYVVSCRVLSILIWSSVLIFVSQPLGYLAAAIGRQAVATRVSAVCLAVNLAANAALIPWLGMEGAAIAAVATETLSLSALVEVSRRNGHRVLDVGLGRVLLRVGLLAGAMGAIVSLLSPADELYVPVAVGFVVYLGGTLAVGTLDKRDLSIIVRLWHLKFQQTPDQG